VTVARPRRRPPRRRRWLRVLAVLLGLAIAFVLGIALGEALRDNPDAGSTQTLVRTLHPLPLVPVVRSTVTVTVTTR
jgi:ferric-dicitrate binding protein FerR (iron transport regulator)